jgi:hypothetical protein
MHPVARVSIKYWKTSVRNKVFLVLDFIILMSHSNHELSTDVVVITLQTNQGAHIRYCAYEWKQYKLI